MVMEATGATTLILRQIQGTLAEHGRMLADHGGVLADHSRRLNGLERLMQEVAGRLGEIRTGMMTTLGFVTHADNRHSELRRDIEKLTRRVGVLEEKV
jgi:hypothetical protein